VKITGSNGVHVRSQWLILAQNATMKDLTPSAFLPS